MINPQCLPSLKPHYFKVCGRTIGTKTNEMFASWLAHTPEAGDVIPGSGGVRKVRWSRKGTGKRGGVRVVYFNRLANGEISLTKQKTVVLDFDANGAFGRPDDLQEIGHPKHTFFLR